MDINCTNKCTYQVDGKCILQDLPMLVSSTYDTDAGCPYNGISSILKNK